MSPKVGLVSLASDEGNEFLGGAFGLGREHGEGMATIVDQETRRIIDEAYIAARKLVEQERPRLVALAEALLKDESLDHDEILKVTNLPPKNHSGRMDPAEVLVEPAVHHDGPPEIA
jgi:cell division protease FtsH